MEKRNYRREMDAIVSTFGERRPTLLMHSCCGPCSTYCLETLAPFFDITVFFYNPNILPVAEFEKRLYWQKVVLEKAPFAQGVKLVVPEQQPQEFYDAAKGLEQEPEGGARCTECFALRLNRTYDFARNSGFDWFATTLTVSPHKDAERINTIGFSLAGEGSTKWLPTDFKKKNGFLRSTQLSRELGLYRQAWCGCGFGGSGPAEGTFTPEE